jgi:hypothetical protein
MSTYLVFQADLSPEQTAQVNAEGWGSSPSLEAYANLLLTREDNAQQLADTATMCGLYKFSYVVDTDTLDTLFDACNGHSKGGDIVRKLRSKANSMSVGDLIMDAWGQFHVCCSTGWKKIDASIELVGSN